MWNLNVSFKKTTMVLLLLWLMFSSCDDEDLFKERISQNIENNQNPSPSEPLEKDSDTIIDIPLDTIIQTPPIMIEPCITNGGRAGDTGLKVWCWGDITLPEFSDRKGVSFNDKQLTVDSECYEKQVTKVGDQLKFRVDPINPEVESWCSRDYNMRAEVHTEPWDIRLPKGTEEWFGWTYTFGNDYVIDQNSEWLFFQVHPGVIGISPHTELMIISKDQYSGHDAGEIYVVNKGNYPDNHPTGLTPKAGDKLKIVVHAVWGDASNGLLQVWINDNKVYDKKVATIYSQYPWGGNAKWGIYKWPWAKDGGVQKSLEQGVTHLETFMGPLRIITRMPGDVDYLSDSYSLVAPN